MTKTWGPRPERLWLVGPMAVGKSTVGRLVATELGWPYLDNDEVLAATTGRVLADWAPGAALHAAEVAVIHDELSRPAPFVACVAASAADHRDLLATMSTAGLLVLLTAPLDVLAARATGTGRPLGDDARVAVAEHWSTRDAHTRAVAGLVLDTSERPAADTAATLVHWVRAQATSS